MTDTESLALSAVRRRPGCSAWSLGVLVDPPEGIKASEWKALLDDELPKLHKAGKIRATQIFGEDVRYWPPGHDVPAFAGKEVIACS